MKGYQVFKSGPHKGQPKTKKDSLIITLIKGGCVEVESRSKYQQFTVPNKEGVFYFIGKAGALRIGKVASKSRSLTHLVRNPEP